MDMAPFDVFSEGFWLEAEAELEFNDPARETIEGSAELSRVNEVGWRSRRRQGFKVQDVEGIEEIAAELKLGVLAQQARVRQVEVLPKGRIELRKPGPQKNVAAPAARPMRGRWNRGRTRKAVGNVRKHTILPVLLGWICDFAAGVGDGHIRTSPITVQVVIRITTTNQRGEGKPGVLGKDTGKRPTACDGAKKVVPTAIKWQLIVTGDV